MLVQVDQPLCIECSRDVVKQVDESIREAEDDIAAYQAALDSLQQENLQPMSSEVIKNLSPASSCNNHSKVPPVIDSNAPLNQVITLIYHSRLIEPLLSSCISQQPYRQEWMSDPKHIQWAMAQAWLRDQQ